jgi:hypothetical protein
MSSRSCTAVLVFLSPAYGGSSRLLPLIVGEILGAIRGCALIASLLEFSHRKDHTGFIVRFLGGKTPKLLQYWTRHSVLPANFCPVYGLLTCGAAVVSSEVIHLFDSRFGVSGTGTKGLFMLRCKPTVRMLYLRFAVLSSKLCSYKVPLLLHFSTRGSRGPVISVSRTCFFAIVAAIPKLAEDVGS